MYNKIIKNLYLGDQLDVIQFEKDFPDSYIIVVLENRPQIYDKTDWLVIDKH